MSLDGFVADLKGGYDWIQDVPSTELDTEHQVPFDHYLQDVDVVVMGNDASTRAGTLSRSKSVRPSATMSG